MTDEQGTSIRATGTETWVTANGIDLLTTTAGSGPRLLVLPGSVADLRKPTSAQNTPLVNNFEVLTYDPRGLGRSAKPDVVYSMADYASDAIAVMRAYGWERAHILGNSFGGMTAQEVAIRYPDMVDRLVLVSSASGGPGGSPYPIEEFVDLPLAEAARRSLTVLDLSFNDDWIAANADAAAERVKVAVDGMTRFADEPNRDIGRNRQLAARSHHNTYDRLGSITAPTLVLAGGRDGQAPVAYQRTLADLIPQGQLTVLDGGHGVLYQHPDSFTIVTNFLESP